MLVITYYWPPSGGSGVQRWLKLCKYLPEFGWEPIVYTPENPDASLTDPSLAANIRTDQRVIKHPIVEPRRIYGKVIGKGKGGADSDEILYLDPSQRSWKQNALVWARSNLLIPDARSLWIRPSVRFLSGYLRDNPVDAIISTGPPHSMHVIARNVKRKLGLPWIADFRDPWTGIVYFDRLPLSKWALRKHRSLEGSVLREADAVVDVTPSWAENDRRRGAKRVVTIYNGFDPADRPEDAPAASRRFTISHLGVLTADRNHEAFWDALSAIADGRADFKKDLEVRLIGRADRSVTQSSERIGLGENVVDVGYLPHGDAVREMHAAAVLLLPINRRQHTDPGIIPGKLYEYLASGRPILLIGPTDGDAAEIVRQSGAGVVCDYDDLAGIRTAISGWYDRHTSGILSAESSDIEKFSRRNQAREYAELLDDVVPRA
ncbi:MAG TPA: glycosyltransferase [Rhodothermales bacterium]|nr:glycosyltransferase [Rhodothermales bacterium]